MIADMVLVNSGFMCGVGLKCDACVFM